MAQDPRQQQSFVLSGGLDLVTPPLQISPGRAISGINYEPAPRGYRRVDGFERFDGQPKPSEASYWVLNFDGGTAGFVEDETVTGAAGATGKCLIDAVVESGSYVGNDAAGYVVLTGVAGTYVDDEVLTGSTAGAATANGTATERGALSDANDTTWLRDAIETARALIAAVPGSGNVRGVWAYNGNVYAFRDNAGGTAGVMHKATTAGWATVALGRELAFTSGGTYEIAEGDVITGATSTETATITRVAVTSGDWSTSDAAGYLYFASQSGAFQAENLDVGANLNVATIAGDSTAITLPAAGRYRFANYNFFGASNLFRMYGCNGVGTGFEFDGTVFVPIHTGMATDKPTFVTAHKKHLFFGFAGGSLQHGGIGDPYVWSPLLGASEIGIGEEITGLMGEHVNVLVIFGRNKVAILTGNDSSDWVMQEIANDAGAIANTAQIIGAPIYLDDRGLRNMATTQSFGDFRLGTLSTIVEPLFAQKKRDSVSATDSIRVRAKDQYRLFWNDGTGVTMYLGRKSPEIMPFDLGVTVQCACSSEDSSGNEIMFFGDASGFVYQIDKGTSFDGDEVQAFLRLPFNNVGSPNHEKQWKKIALHLDANVDTALSFTAEFGYADPDLHPASEQTFTVDGQGGFWDEDNFDEFFWSAAVEGKAEGFVSGIGRNISVAIMSDATYEESHVIHGCTLHFCYRGPAK